MVYELNPFYESSEIFRMIKDYKAKEFQIKLDKDKKVIEFIEDDKLMLDVSISDVTDLDELETVLNQMYLKNNLDITDIEENDRTIDESWKIYTIRK